MPRHIRTILTCVAASVAAFAAQPSKPSAQPEFRVVSYMNGYEFPTLSVEGSPGQFYVTATIPSTDGMAALSVNTKGQITTSATFPKTYLIDGVLIGGPDGHTYAATQNGSFVATTFSVTAAPNSLQAYPPAQDFIPALYQNLP
jgi:hypothetical protein